MKENLFYGGELAAIKPKSGYYWISTRIVRESGPWYAESINSPEKVVDILNEHMDFSNLDREHLIALYLNKKNSLLGIQTVSIGTLDSADVHPREVFKSAIMLGASGIIIAHNHPSGDSTPSEADRKVTKRLIEAGELLAVQVLDHVIVGNDFYSFQAREPQLFEKKKGGKQ